MGDRNKGGVGNFYTIPRARRSEVRKLARQFVAEFCRSTDTPEWVYNHGITHANGEATEFMQELHRIADRIEKTNETSKP